METSGDSRALVGVLLFGWLFFVVQWLFPRLGFGGTSVVHGRDLEVEVPLRVCDTCWNALSLHPTAVVRDMLRRDPSCAAMLDFYSDATVEWQ